MSTQGKHLVTLGGYVPGAHGLISCATTGEGLFEGLQWLSQNVKKRQQ